MLGDVDKNPNFQDRYADLIINEVVGGNQSQLKGPLEVAGDRASVIISNPNGITVNGGGFLNMSVATLTTGKPTLNNEGFLDNLRITKGQINIESDGLDGSFDSIYSIDSIDIISITLNLTGRINGQGNNISIIQGTNQINYGGYSNQRNMKQSL
ncbi:filamentous hemagglutinin N-terminal domain-containing protein [Xenorhabdus cabanillasii]|uniref:two-partner secretion domain-containing protein n=1 Tax=Xenorhabdus cabanillasii TaxID=351673 RepID=UPI0024680B3C|nr:filamentous hemagglutinin N-terminal domain-containing protein [Xenorhabdus cabanillasii]